MCDSRKSGLTGECRLKRCNEIDDFLATDPVLGHDGLDDGIVEHFVEAWLAIEVDVALCAGAGVIHSSQPVHAVLHGHLPSLQAPDAAAALPICPVSRNARGAPCAWFSVRPAPVRPRRASDRPASSAR